MNKSYIFLANGFEEVETISTIDILRRAGVDVATVSIDDTPSVTGAHGISVAADMGYTQVLGFNDADFLILPGGMPGATNLAAFAPLNSLLRSHAADGGNIAAICAAPAVVLAPLGILKGRKAICYPGFEDQLKEAGAKIGNPPVCVDGNIVTSNGPASATAFALAIVAKAVGEQKAREVGEGLLYYKSQAPFYF